MKKIEEIINDINGAENEAKEMVERALSELHEYKTQVLILIHIILVIKVNRIDMYVQARGN